MSTDSTGSRAARKTIIGFVSSRSGDKSVKVTIPYKTPHALYHKVINRKTVVHVHDEKNETQVGDKVEIMETEGGGLAYQATQVQIEKSESATQEGWASW